MKTKLPILRALIFLINIFFILKSYSQNAHNAFESYYFHVTPNYPQSATPSWGDADWATGGLAHDNNHWYIGATGRDALGITDNLDWAVWRWPVTEALDQDLGNGDHGVITFQLYGSNTDTTFKKYGHIGDMDRVIHNGVDYLLLPLTSGQGLPPVIAFFRASNLTFINYAVLTKQGDVGWCAVTPLNNGAIYTSKDDADSIIRYTINWNIIFNSQNQHDPNPSHHNGLTWSYTKKLKPIIGQRIILHNMQGGEFTPSGGLLYVSCGIVDCIFGGTAYPTDGIHAFSTLNWQEVQRSTNHDRPPNNTYCFDYSFDNDGCYSDEPEGLTIWDVDGLGAPNVSGQLHVLLDRHEIYTPYISSSNLTIKHYESFKCPSDISVECSAYGGTPATNPAIVAFLNQSTFAGCASVLHSTNTFFPSGITPVFFTATDNSTVNVTCTANVNVIDTKPPIITCPPNITVECSAHVGTPKNDPQLNVFFNGVSATDICEASLNINITNNAPPLFPLGATSVTFTAIDGSGNHASCSSIVTVEDTTPPVITTNTQDISIWPPNHNYHTINVQDFIESVTDICDDSIGIGSIRVLSVESDEAEDANGGGDGNTSQDIIITCPNTVQVRAERQGSSNGRVYKILYAATDHSGNRSSVVCKVHVPHDGSNQFAVEGPGPGYLVTSACDVLRQIPFNNSTLALNSFSPSAELQQIYPNPFNVATKIEFFIPQKDFVSLKVYNFQGEEVALLVSKELEVGEYSFEWNATGLPNGVYVSRLESGAFTQSKKFVLLK